MKRVSTKKLKQLKWVNKTTMNKKFENLDKYVADINFHANTFTQVCICCDKLHKDIALDFIKWPSNPLPCGHSPPDMLIKILRQSREMFASEGVWM